MGGQQCGTTLRRQVWVGREAPQSNNTEVASDLGWSQILEVKGMWEVRGGHGMWSCWAELEVRLRLREGSWMMGRTEADGLMPRDSSRRWGEGGMQVRQGECPQVPGSFSETRLR